MRIFVGLRPSDDFRMALAVLQDRLRCAGITGRYLDPSNLHMTLAFIGEWTEDVTQVLPSVEYLFTITLGYPGIFPEAKVLWAGIEKSEELNRLAQCVRDRLAEHGIPFDPKEFQSAYLMARETLDSSGVDLAGIRFQMHPCLWMRYAATNPNGRERHGIHGDRKYPGLDIK